MSRGNICRGPFLGTIGGLVVVGFLCSFLMLVFCISYVGILFLLWAVCEMVGLCFKCVLML